MFGCPSHLRSSSGSKEKLSFPAGWEGPYYSMGLGHRSDRWIALKFYGPSRVRSVDSPTILKGTPPPGS